MSLVQAIHGLGLAVAEQCGEDVPMYIEIGHRGWLALQAEVARTSLGGAPYAARSFVFWTPGGSEVTVRDEGAPTPPADPRDLMGANSVALGESKP